jgi:molecular chaperone GrpE
MITKSENTAAPEKENEKADSPLFRVIDKRQFLDLDQIDVSTQPEYKPRYPTMVEELMGRLAETEKRFDERKALMQEEISRTRTRLEADFQRRVEAEKQSILLPFLEVLDNLERALAAVSRGGSPDSLRQGVEMIASLFRQKLQAQAIQPVEVLGLPFDPNVGQAVAMVQVAKAAQDGIVVDELQRGYRIGEQLLRPAQVRVGTVK